MTTIVFSVGAQVMRGPTQAEDFSYTVAETPIVVGGSAADSSFYDATNTLTTASGVVNNCQLQVHDSFLLPGHSFVNQTPSVASVDSAGNVAMVTLGSANVDIVTPVGKRRFSRIMTNTATTSLSFKQYKTGSLGAHVVAAINTMIQGKTPGQATQQLTSANNYNTAAPSVTRNASLFTGSLDLTAISVMRKDTANSITDGAFPVLLISPRHVIAAGHILGGAGTVVWQDSTGAYHTADIVSTAIGAFSDTDIGVGYLSAPISGITPFSFLPTNWQNYLGSLADNSINIQRLPCLSKLEHPNDIGGTSDSYTSAMCITEMYTLLPGSTGGYQNALVHSGSAVSPIYQQWTDGSGNGVRGGDSGSPIMLPINGKAVLLSAHASGAGGGNWAEHGTWIESQMNSLASAQGDSTAYAMLRADLSAFTQFTSI